MHRSPVAAKRIGPWIILNVVRKLLDGTLHDASQHRYLVLMVVEAVVVVCRCVRRLQQHMRHSYHAWQQHAQLHCGVAHPHILYTPNRCM